MGVINTGMRMQNSAIDGLVAASRLESQRKMANDTLKQQQESAEKSRNATAAGIGAYVAPKVAGYVGSMSAPASALESAAGTAVMQTGFTPVAGVTAEGAALTEGAVMGAAPIAEATSLAAPVVAEATAAPLAGEIAGSALIPGIGWVAAAGLGVYALGSMFDWW